MRSLAIAALLGAAACGSAIEPTGTDAELSSVGQDASIALPLHAVEVGTGVERYEPLTTDEVVPIVLGAQGGGRVMGYHIYGGVRTKGYKQMVSYVVYTITREDTGEELARTDRRDRLFQPDGDGNVFYGMAPRLTDCCAAVNARLKMRVEVTDACGNLGTDERTVIGGPSCNDAAGNSLCP